MQKGRYTTKAEFVIYAGIDIAGQCNAPLCAHSANTEISSVKLICGSSLPGGELGERTALQKSGLTKSTRLVFLIDAKLCSAVMRAGNTSVCFNIKFSLTWTFFKVSKSKTFSVKFSLSYQTNLYTKYV